MAFSNAWSQQLKSTKSGHISQVNVLYRPVIKQKEQIKTHP